MAFPLHRYIGKFLLSAAALFIIFLACIQIVLVVGINAFNTGRAHDFIEGKINSALDSSGFNLRFSHLFYDPVRGLTIRNAVLEDESGPFFLLNRLSVSIAWAQIPLRSLDIIASGENVQLLRLPASGDEASIEEPTDDTGIQPFAVPDIYFKNIEIISFKIDHLHIGEAVAGQPLSFSPHLKSKLSLTDQIDLGITMRPHAKSAIQNLKIPSEIGLSATLDSQALSLQLKELKALSDDYSINASGSGALTEGATLDFKLQAEYPDLKPLTEENIESLSLEGSIGGAYPKATYALNGKIVPAELSNKGLSDINISLLSDEPAERRIHTKIETSYKDLPVLLQSALQYDEGILKVETLNGEAPSIKISGNGSLDTASAIFDGDLSLAAQDLSQYKDLLGQDIAGSIKIDAALKELQSMQAANITIEANSLRYQNYALGKATGKVGYDALTSPWPQDLSLTLSQISLPDIGSLTTIDANIKKIDENSYTLTTKGNGVILRPISFNGSANLSDLTNAIPTIRDLALQTQLGTSKIDLNGDLDAQNINIEASTKNFSGKDIPTDLPQNIADISLSGKLSMNGPMSGPTSNADVTVSLPKIAGQEDMSITASILHDSGILSGKASGTGTGIRKLDATINMPMALSLSPFSFNLDQNAALKGNITADISLLPIGQIFLPPTQNLSGGLDIAGSIEGTVEAPSVNGNFSFKNVAFTDEENGIFLSDVQAAGTFTQSMLTLSSLRGTDGENGQMSGQGVYSFGDQVSADFSVSMDNFHLPRSEMANGVLGAKISLTGRDNQYNVGGTIDIEEMNIVIPETFQSNIPELNIVDRNESSDKQTESIISFAINVNAENQIFVRGWGLDAEFGGDLEIGGNMSAPQVNGTLGSIRGRYEEFGKRFTLERANLRFQGDTPPSPYLDIEATTAADDVTASILLTGPVKTPKISFSSSPALPEDEVLSRILFGRDMSRISPFQAVQLAQTLQRFSGKGGGGFDALGQLRSLTGLDDISVDTDESGETNVGVGKYLTDKVYLEVERGKAENSGQASIQIEVTPSVNIQSEIGQDASAGGGIFWKRDY